MYKYEMDLASIVEDTEQKLLRSQTGRQLDGRTNKVKPFNFVEAGGIMSRYQSQPTLPLSQVPLLLLTLYMLSFFWGNINIYLDFMSLLHIDMTQVLKIFPQVRPGPTYSM